MKRNSAHERAAALLAPDLRRYIDGEPASGFLEWCEATAEQLATANTPDQRAYARIMRAMLVATIESANTARERDGVEPVTVTLFVPRCAMTAAVTALISVFKESTPTAELREIVIRELDFVLALMAPGATIGAD
ncbi:MAG: hypothetical protein AB7O88_28460 [Reyranellaceae bacterium]